MNRQTSKKRTRAGFTLVEVLIVMTLLGILSTIAIPRVRKAMYSAQAARIASDVRSIKMAASFYLEENGRFPRNAGWGRVPPQMEEHLATGIQFRTEDADYRWTARHYRNGNGPFDSTDLGIIRVRHRNNPGLSEAMKALRGDYVVWTRNRTTFYFPQ